MGLPELSTVDLASLERFQTELIKSGFEPCTSNRRVWVGPIANSLKELTASAKMKIVFVDGWPFRPPALYVKGLEAWHLSADGQVCLWNRGVFSCEWLTVDGYMQRIADWAARARGGFNAEDFALDAHLSFDTVRSGAIATIDLGSLGFEEKSGEIGEISGSWNATGSILEIARGQKQTIEGRWYYVGAVPVPPRNLDDVRALLNTNQKNNFDRRFRAIANHSKPQLFLIIFDREFGREALVLLAQNGDSSVDAVAIEVAPTDVAVLKLRAGPDADALAEKRVAIFGLGAVGSKTALQLAEVGIGHLVLVDDARLRPGDIVRHAAGSWAVGSPKVAAVYQLIRMKAPWTGATCTKRSPWAPDEIADILRGADLVVEATGFTSFAALLSVICAEQSLPLVSVALYRAGFVGRVRRQALPSDTPIFQRSDDECYPTIPPGQEPPAFEPGCSAPVNNASPIAVSAIAALAAQIAVDHLATRDLYPDEIIEIYQSLERAPFDKVGRLG